MIASLTHIVSHSSPSIYCLCTNELSSCSAIHVFLDFLLLLFSAAVLLEQEANTSFLITRRLLLLMLLTARHLVAGARVLMIMTPGHLITAFVL